MRKFVAAAAFVFVAFVSIVSAQRSGKQMMKCTGVSGLTRAEIAEILNAHNQVRSELKLASLKWDCKLADYAQAWAKLGHPAHRDEDLYGESIFVGSAADISAVIAVNRWMLEKPAWNNTSATCMAGKTCTHYTQIVWKKTARIGCGINRNVSGKWKVMLVCNYDPAGNTSGPAY
jgi:pathogenesis-related protein 1